MRREVKDERKRERAREKEGEGERERERRRQGERERAVYILGESSEGSRSLLVAASDTVHLRAL